MKSIFLFTHSYPYGKDEETFLSAEIDIVSRRKIDLTIIPLKKRGQLSALPIEIKLNKTLAETSYVGRFVIFIKMLLSPLFWKIPFQDKHSPKSPRQYYYAIKYLYGSFMIKHFIVFNKSMIPDNSIIYCYWFNHSSLGAVLAKLYNPTSFNFKIITRGHGFDVFEDKVGMYFPYRQLNLKFIDHVYTVSNAGKHFLEKKYAGFNKKISVARLGTLPIKNYSVQIKGDTLSFLSCSSIIPLKRVELIFNSILKYSIENPHKIIKWTHFGSGYGFNDLKNLVKRNSLINLVVDLKGFVDNNIIREILAKERFDMFINLSISEGVPVSIMEAISVGIPVLATDVGGNNEIVTSETGLLLQENFTQNSFNLAVNELIALEDSLRESAYSFYMTNFNAEVNYSAFYNELLNEAEPTC